MNSITNKIYDYDKRIQKTRKEQNKTQKQLCEYLDRTIQNVSAIENGKQAYTENTAKKIAGFLNVDYRYLTYDINTKTFKEQMKYICDVMEQRKVAFFLVLNAYGYDIKKSDFMYWERGYIKICDYDKLSDNRKKSALYDPDPVYIITTPEHEQKIIHESDLTSLFKDTIYLLNSRLLCKERLDI